MVPRVEQICNVRQRLQSAISRSSYPLPRTITHTRDEGDHLQCPRIQPLWKGSIPVADFGLFERLISQDITSRTSATTLMLSNLLDITASASFSRDQSRFQSIGISSTGRSSTLARATIERGDAAVTECEVHRIQA
ncbi:hypothetical protein DPSP01_012031 [Paraphaeosphaeria sporulosa]